MMASLLESFGVVLDGDVEQLYWTGAYSLGFYLTLTVLVNLLGIDAWILSKSKDKAIREASHSKSKEGVQRRVYMCSTAQSLLSSIVSTVTAFHLAYTHRNWHTYTPEKLLFNPDPHTFFYCSLMAGYFASDLIVEIVYYRCFEEFGMIIHHVIFLFCCVHNLKNKVFTFQFIWLSLCETSTPFVNVRWILHVLGRKDSALYLYNGGLLTLTFLFFRVFVYTFGLYHLYTIYPVLLHSDKPFASKFVVPTFLVVGYMLNLLWSTKILRGLISLIRKRTAKKAQ